MSDSPVSPYPFERWPRLRPEDVVRLRRVARAVPSGSLDAMCATLGELLGAHVTLTSGPIYACEPGALAESLAEPLVAIVLRPPGPERPLVVELASDLALVLVDRLLGGDGSQVGDAIGGLTELECGVVAYAAARVLGVARRPWTVAGVLTTRLAVLGTLGDEGSATWSAELELTFLEPAVRPSDPTSRERRRQATEPSQAHAGDEDGGRTRRSPVRVWIPDATRWDDGAGSRVGFSKLPLELVVDGGEVTLAAAELLTLKPADVLLLDDAWWRRERTLRLRLVGARATTWWAQDEDGAIAVRRIESGPGAGATNGARRNTMSEETATLKTLGDAPVEVSVELARIRLTLAELHALRVGEVVASGAPIGEHVRLRVGDVVIGEGELVEIDGQIGVRLASLDAE
ncbi:MAG: FliM/FliN family flagellar motor switch protein [Myxococcota bacterium]|nr:FliM/FliN family flagellar motor switch protein [Myxococcota bacterium]